MPYAANTDLPTFRAAFNHAFENHRDDPRQEEIAHRSAWSAVKRQYEKAGDVWVRRDGHDD